MDAYVTLSGVVSATRCPRLVLVSIVNIPVLVFIAFALLPQWFRRARGTANRGFERFVRLGSLSLTFILSSPGFERPSLVFVASRTAVAQRVFT